MMLNDLIANSPLKDEKIIVCKENSKEVRLITNNQKFYKIHLDDDKLLSNEQTRCDFMIVSEDKRSVAIWIELKGSDIKHACEQIQSSIKDYGKEIVVKYVAIVFSSKTGPKAKTYIQILQKNIKINLFYGSDKIQLEYNSPNKIIKTN